MFWSRKKRTPERLVAAPLPMIEASFVAPSGADMAPGAAPADSPNGMRASGTTSAPEGAHAPGTAFVGPSDAHCASGPWASDGATKTSKVGGAHMTMGICGRRLTYDDGARVFVGWLQDNGETGEIPLARLRLLYVRHCEDLNLAWLPENQFLAALTQAIGRQHKHERAERSDGAPRRRYVTYDIPVRADAAHEGRDSGTRWASEGRTKEPAAVRMARRNVA